MEEEKPLVQKNPEMLQGERTCKLNHSEWRNIGIRKEKRGTEVFGDIMQLKEEKERVGDFNDINKNSLSTSSIFSLAQKQPLCSLLTKPMPLYLSSLQSSRNH